MALDHVLVSKQHYSFPAFPALCTLRSRRQRQESLLAARAATAGSAGAASWRQCRSCLPALRLPRGGDSAREALLACSRPAPGLLPVHSRPAPGLLQACSRPHRAGQGQQRGRGPGPGSPPGSDPCSALAEEMPGQRSPGSRCFSASGGQQRQHLPVPRSETST